jgi:hypothetical protein
MLHIPQTIIAGTVRGSIPGFQFFQMIFFSYLLIPSILKNQDKGPGLRGKPLIIPKAGINKNWRNYTILMLVVKCNSAPGNLPC